MKRDLSHKDIVWKNISKLTYFQKQNLSNLELIKLTEELEAELYRAIFYLVKSATGNLSGVEETKTKEDYTIEFLKDYGYIKDTEN